MLNSLISKYGWKTVTGCFVLAAGQIMQTIPVTAPYAPVATALGTVLGGVGIRAAVAKLAEDTKESTELPRPTSA